jgi:hypothetical protein
MTSNEILKKFNDEWDRLSIGKNYYDIPITIRKAFFTHACNHIQHDVELFIMVHGCNHAIFCFGKPIVQWCHNGIEPEEDNDD